MDATLAGLSRALILEPSHGYFEAMAGLTSGDGLWTQAEVGYRPAAHWAIFGQGFYRGGDFGAAAGVRGEF